MKNYCFVDHEKWIRCIRCGHKLGRVKNESGMGDVEIEIKCHSCKQINTFVRYKSG